MACILEYITVNYAVVDQNEAVAKFSALGLTALGPNVMPEPPAQIRDITFPMGRQGAISLVAPTDKSSTVQKFLDRRGEGTFSLAVRVDNISEAMSEWPAYGIEWVLAKPYEFPPGTAAARYRVEKLKANWIKPGSLNGLLMECFEFCGNVEEIKS
tara:strand:- start:831 stop:1298 length:468 start_codon:yes stop_codon:yes gene_type:complete